MNALKLAAIGAEVTVISTLAISSYHVAFAGADPDWLAGAPIVTVVALESMRLPLAFKLPRMRPLGLICGVAMLAGLSVITGEAASVAFENLIFQRARPVVEAETELKKVSISHGALDTINARRAEEIARLTADLGAARKHREEIDKPVVLQPIAGDAIKYRMVGTGRHAKWAPYNANAGIQAVAANADAAAQAAHSAELKTASDLVAQAQAKLDAASANPPPDMHVSDEEVAAAKQKVADARSSNVMFRVAAAWQRTPVEELTSEQFEVVKHYAVIALAIATAITTALAAVIASLPERDGKESRLARAIRAFAARWRKRLVIRRNVPGPVRYVDRLIHVPVDELGRVVDRRAS